MNINFFKRYITTIIAIIIVTVSIVPFGSSISINNFTGFEKQSAPLSIDWWSMFHNDANQNGFSTSSAPDSNDVLWSYQTDYLITSSPNIVNGKLYIGSLDRKFYCFDMMNGNILWNYTINGRITGSSAVGNGKVFFGSQDSTFYCLDADNGSLIWEFNTNFMIESSPTVKDDKVFFGSSDGSLYCLNADNGSLIWEYSIGNVIWTSPAITEDRLYFGTVGGDFFCLDTINGDFIWSYSTTSGIWSSPAIYNGTVFFGSNDKYVYCLDKDDGSLIWKYDTGGEVHSSPAIAYGNVYIGSSGQGLFCLDTETGDLVWKYLINNGIWSSPSVADNKIFYGNDPCCGTPAYFYCTDAFSGELIWQYNIGGDIGMKSAPGIAAGIVFIGAGNGEVFAFGGNELYADAHGPYTGVENTPIQFKGSVYGGNPDYSYHWDFGDGKSSNEQNPTHIFTTPDEYNVTFTVNDNGNNVAIDETLAYIEERINNPPNVPVIEGPINGGIDKKYTYCISSIVDPNDDKLYIFWDWGDETNTDWQGPYNSSEQVCEQHIWNNRGNYTIKVKLKDEYGEESDWGYLEVTIPRYKMTANSLFQRLIEKLPNAFPILRLFLKL